MSYALEVKEELTRLKLNNSNEIFTMLEGILRCGFDISFNFKKEPTLIFSSKSNAIIRYVIFLLQTFHKVNYKLYQKQIMHFDKPTYFYLEIDEEANLFIKDYSLLSQHSERKEEILASEKLKAIYLRAAFIVKGSINDPKGKSYHLEYSLNNQSEALFIQSILNSYDFNARIIKRKDNYVVYVKEINIICDILRIMGALDIVFNLEQVLITKQLKADTKRKINFEIANQSKTNASALNELKYIKYLEMYYPLQKLDPKILLVMKVRKDNKEASLTELVQILKDEYGENITKSGLAHRIRKLKEIALDYKKRQK